MCVCLFFSPSFFLREVRNDKEGRGIIFVAMLALEANRFRPWRTFCPALVTFEEIAEMNLGVLLLRGFGRFDLRYFLYSYSSLPVLEIFMFESVLGGRFVWRGVG